ncbi:MAG: hypothetical protein COA69_13745 [Robiginitomaculum sp.]|nr:MAG: hypothetical protein COA69_13745 [Robiginitomaculum sp.]
MSKIILTFTSLLSVSLLPLTALADEAQDFETGTQCLSAKKLVKALKKFDGMKPGRIDTVQTTANMRLKANEGDKLPARLFHRNKDVETDFMVAEDGKVVDFKKMGDLSKKGELCLQDSSLVKKTREETKGRFGLSIDFTVAFKNTSGTHSIAELIDGTGDGKSHYKKMFGGPMSILVPKMTHIGITPKRDDIKRDDTGNAEDAEIAPLTITALKDGAVLSGLNIGEMGAMQVIGIKDLRDLGADTLLIAGNSYTMTPVPSVAKMKKFGFGPSSDKSGDKSGDKGEKSTETASVDGQAEE